MRDRFANGQRGNNQPIGLKMTRSFAYYSKYFATVLDIPRLGKQAGNKGKKRGDGVGRQSAEERKKDSIGFCL